MPHVPRSSHRRRPAEMSTKPARAKHRASEERVSEERVPISGTSPIASVAPTRGLDVAAVVSLDEDSRRAQLRLDDGSTPQAELAPSLSPIVVRGAISRGEPLVVKETPAGWVVLGALRTAPTPGLDKGDSYVIEARRVELRGDHEVALVSGRTTQIVLRAVGLVETIAQDISTRAAGVHKIIGRMLHLN